VLIGAAAGPLAACGGRTEQPTRPPAPPAPGQVLATTAEVPVGSGTVVDDTVVTQPAPGVFHGFVARCTHAGCLLTNVVDGAIVCPCHGSRFNLDGEVTRGPAVAPLKPAAVTVRGNSILAG